MALSFIDGVTSEQFVDDDLRQHAVCAVAQVGEHVKKLSKRFVASQPKVAWKAIAGARDWIVHDYGNLDFDEIYKSVTDEAEGIIELVSRAIDEIGVPEVSVGDAGAQVLRHARSI